MSEEDDSMEHVHEIHHQAHGATERWISVAALTAAILAALAAITGSLAGVALTTSNRAQLAATDQWAQYQAKSIKQTLVRSKIDLMQVLGKTAPEKDAQDVERYEKEKKEIEEKAHHAEEQSERDLHHHEILERGVTLFHVAIAIVAIAVLVRRPSFWYGSLVCGIAGVVFLIMGLMGH